MVKGETMTPKVQELSDKVLLVTFDPLVSEYGRNIFNKQLEDFGFKVVWTVG